MGGGVVLSEVAVGMGQNLPFPGLVQPGLGSFPEDKNFRRGLESLVASGNRGDGLPTPIGAPPELSPLHNILSDPAKINKHPGVPLPCSSPPSLSLVGLAMQMLWALPSKCSLLTAALGMKGFTLAGCARNWG